MDWWCLALNPPCSQETVSVRARHTFYPSLPSIPKSENHVSFCTKYDYVCGVYYLLWLSFKQQETVFVGDILSVWSDLIRYPLLLQSTYSSPTISHCRFYGLKLICRISLGLCIIRWIWVFFPGIVHVIEGWGLIDEGLLPSFLKVWRAQRPVRRRWWPSRHAEEYLGL